MVKSCCVRGCHNRQDRESDRRYFQIPSVVTSKGEQTEELTTRRRKEWLAQLQLSNYTFESTTRRVVCSDHFIDGKIAYLYDIQSANWKPTLKLGHDRVKGRKSLHIRGLPARVAGKQCQNADGSSSSTFWDADVPLHHDNDHDHIYAGRAGRPGGKQSSKCGCGYTEQRSHNENDFNSSCTTQLSSATNGSTYKSTKSSKTNLPQERVKDCDSKNGKKFCSSPKETERDRQDEDTPWHKKRKLTWKSFGGQERPGVKSSLKAFLSGHNNTAGTRRMKDSLSAVQCHKKTKGESNRAGSGAGTPTPCQGLEALLEAVSQIEGTDTCMLDFLNPSSMTSPVVYELSVTNASLAADPGLAGECIVNTACSFSPA